MLAVPRVRGAAGPAPAASRRHAVPGRPSDPVAAPPPPERAPPPFARAAPTRPRRPVEAGATTPLRISQRLPAAAGLVPRPVRRRCRPGGFRDPWRRSGGRRGRRPRRRAGGALQPSFSTHRWSHHIPAEVPPLGRPAKASRPSPRPLPPPGGPRRALGRNRRGGREGPARRQMPRRRRDRLSARAHDPCGHAWCPGAARAALPAPTTAAKVDRRPCGPNSDFGAARRPRGAALRAEPGRPGRPGAGRVRRCRPRCQGAASRGVGGRKPLVSLT